MATLGNYLPDPLKQQHIERHLHPGQVLYLSCDFTTPPKEKYVIFACAGAWPLLFIINSNIRPYIAQRPVLNQCQVCLRAADYPFLDHDSFADCSRVIEQVSEDVIRAQILADVSRLKGALTPATKTEIVRAVQGAKTISRHHKDLIANALA
jgi:hypothetical protein